MELPVPRDFGLRATKLGYTVGEACNFGAEPLVAVDGVLRAIEDVFQMVETYNRRRA